MLLTLALLFAFAAYLTIVSAMRGITVQEYIKSVMG